MKKLLLALLILSGIPLCAQTTTTYTGTIKDLTGATVTSGRITWQLNAPSGGVIPGTGAFVSSTVSCLINASGAPVSSADGTSACVITSNTSLTPTGTSYTICIQPYNATPGSCFVTYATGGTVNISTLVPTPATMPSYGVCSTAACLSLAGGTLTGPLNGTTAAFSGAVSGVAGTFSGPVSGSSVASGSTVTATTAALAPVAQVNSAQAIGTSVAQVILDDDCASDPDCIFTDTLIHHWVDSGRMKVLAIIADSGNVSSAPVRHIFANYSGHGYIPLGAWQGADVPGGSSSLWAGPLVAQFNAGDTRANYPSCLTVYRQQLAAAANSSVTILSTGFATCLVQLIQSSADSISPLTGAQLVQAKVAKLVVMGGSYPSGTESNFFNDRVNFSTLFSSWTVPNGYPPIYMVGNTIGVIFTGTPTTWPAFAPSRWVQINVPTAFPSANQSTSVDQLAVLFAIFGTPNQWGATWTISASGTNTVNSSTGANSWSSGVPSGHFVLTNANGQNNSTVQTEMSYFPTFIAGGVGASQQAFFGGASFGLFGTLNTNAGGNMNPTNAVGSFNTACGAFSLLSLTGGNDNTACGQGSLISLTTGSNNTASGQNSLFGITTQSGNTGVGVNAGGTGSTGLVNGTYLGFNAIAAASSDANETVVGANTTGNGSNTATIGNGSVTDTFLAGAAHSASTVTGAYANNQTLTITTLAAAGSGGSFSAFVCASGSTCGPNYGLLQGVMGTAPTTGDLVKIVWGTTAFAHKATCVSQTVDATSLAVLPGIAGDSGNSTNVQATFYAFTAPVAAHLLDIFYLCF